MFLLVTLLSNTYLSLPGCTSIYVRFKDEDQWSQCGEMLDLTRFSYLLNVT